MNTSHFSSSLLKHAAGKLIAAFLVCTVMCAQALAVYWTDKTKSDYDNGYFVLNRTTATASNTLRISEVTDWYSAAWSNRIPLTINNTGSAQLLYRYQMDFTFDTKSLIDTGKMRGDMGDVRFTGPDGITLLPYYIATGSGTATRFIVKVSSISATTTNIFMYYNNLSTGGVSSIKNTYDLYEGWDDPTPPSHINGSIWDTGGTLPFTVTSDSSMAGGWSVQSGTITHSQSSYIKTTINLEMTGMLTFYWAASSERYSDLIRFYIDGTLEQAQYPYGVRYGIPQDNYEQNWTMRVYYLTAGVHDLKWEYSRDGSGVEGLSKTWVDSIMLTKFVSPAPTVSAGSPENRTDFYTEGYYQSRVFDTGAENTIINLTSWSYVTNGGTELYIKMRSSNSLFIKDAASPSWTGNLTNGVKPLTLSAGRYFQYQAWLKGLSSGTTTPYLIEVSNDYISPPTAPTNFTGVALSTSSVKWTWADNSSGDLQEDGYRLYSSTGGILYSMGVNVVEYTEYNFAPNTGLTRYVAAYNSNGENISNSSTTYTLAETASCLPEEFHFQIGGGYYYTQITTGTELYTSTFTFTSVPTTNTVEFYRTAMTTYTPYSILPTDRQWVPSTSTVQHPQTGDWMTKKPSVSYCTLFNATSWYFTAQTYNKQGFPSGITTLGPFNFQGCPSHITDLTASPSSDTEGCIALTWTAPSADGAGVVDLTGGQYIIKGRNNFMIVDDNQFNNAETSFTISTSPVAGQRQSYTITGLTPGSLWGFSIKSVDTLNNYSRVSTNIAYSTNTMTNASAISKIGFYTAAKSAYVGTETSDIIIETWNANDMPLKVTSDVTVYLNSTSQSRSFGQGSSWGLTSIIIPAGSNQASFKYRDNSYGTPTITASAGSWTSGTQVENIASAKAVRFMIDHDPSGNTGNIGVDKTITIRANDGYNDGNASANYRGAIVATCTVLGISITPSTHTYTEANAGSKTLTVGNKGDYAYAGPVTYSVQETTTQDYTGVLDSMLIGDEGLIKSRDSEARWFTQKYSTGTENGLYGLSSPNGTYFWASAAGGKVFKSTDTGETWTTYNTGLAADKTLYSVYFVDISTGWAVGTDGKIVKSGDGGLTWFEQTSGTAVKLKSVFFVNLSTGFAVGDNRTLLKTNDSGQTWQDMLSHTSTSLNKVNFFDSATGYAVGDGGLIYKTTDGGVNWTPQTANVTSNLYSIDFFSSNLGYAAGASRTIIKTANGGTTWSLAASTAAAPDLFDISFVGSNSDKITAVGASGTILQTTNSGASWATQVMSGVSTAFYWNGLTVYQPQTLATSLFQGKLNNGIKLGVRTLYSGTSTIDQIRVKKAVGSTAADSDITSIAVYRDTNGNGIYDTNDTKLGEAALSSGKASINVSRTFTSDSTDYIFIMPNVGTTTSGLGKTFGMTLDFTPDTDRFLNVISGVQFAGNSLPYTFSPVEIVPSSCTLTIGFLNLSPVEVKQGQRNVLISSFTMITDRGETQWRRLVVARTGENNVDADIESIKLFKSPSPNFVDASVIATGVFGAVSQGLAYIDITTESSIKSDVMKYYFLAVDISPSAVYYTDTTPANFQLSFGMTTSYFLLDNEGLNGINSSAASFSSGQIKIKQALDTLVVEPITGVPFTVDQSNTASFIPLKFYVTESGARVDITRIHVIQTGTASDSDVESVRLYKDNNGNATLDTPDTLLGSIALSSKEGDIILTTPEIVTTTLSSYATYFIAASISKRATVESTVQLLINTGGITLAGTDAVSTLNFPVNSPVATIKNFRDVVNVSFTNIMPKEARVDETGIGVARIKLWAYCSAILTKMTLELTGTAGASNVTAAKIYSDTDANDIFSSASDTLLGSGTFGADGKSEITLSVTPTIYDSSSTIFIVYDFNSAATPQKTVGAGLSDSTLIFPGEGGANAFGYYQSGKLNLLNKETPSVPQLVLNVGFPSGKQIGGRTVYFSNNSAELGFSWESTALNGISKANYAMATYEIYSTTDTPDLTGWFEATATEKDAKLQDLNLRHNTLYYLWVKAVSIDGYERVTCVPMKIDLTPPGVPLKPDDTSPKARSALAFAAAQSPSSSYWVSWTGTDDPESGVLYYEVQERSGTSPVWQNISTTTAAEYKVVKDTETDQGKFFYYRIRAINYAGSWGSFSDSSGAAYLSLPAEFIKDLASYPNPFDSRRKSATITYLANQDADVTMKVYDLFGGLVKEWKTSAITGENKTSWDGCDDGGQKVAAGMYILYLEIKNADTTEKKRWKIGVIH